MEYIYPEQYGQNLSLGSRVCTRETMEGWLLLTVETEANGDSKSTNERGSSMVDR
jgi:hypothetical protein